MRKLEILDSRPTDEGLTNLARLSQLEELIFYRSPINDKGFIHLKSMHSLKKLEFVGREIHDDNLYHLKGLKGLESLKPLNVSDKGLAYLAELENLRCLEFSHQANITDSGLEHLGKLRFVIEGLQVRRPARLAQVNHPFRLGGEVQRVDYAAA